jgi:uncharacterized membrane protein YfcA
LEDITPLIALALIALGLGAGTYGVLIGSGGGFIIAPLLIIVFNVDHNLAVGTSLVVVLLSSTSGSLAYRRLGHVDLRAALLFSAVAVPGTILGVLGLKLVPGDTFQIIMGALLGILGLFLMLRPATADAPTATQDSLEGAVPPSSPGKTSFGQRTSTIVTADMGTLQYTYNEPVAVSMNSVFGFISGFFGMGGGPIRTPTLVYLFHFPVAIATATSVFAQMIYTGVGSAAHIIDGNVDFPVMLLVGAGVVAGAQIAVRLSRLVKGQLIMRLLSVALLGISLQLILKGTDAI